MPICGLLASTTLGWKLIYYTMGAATLVTSLLWAAFTASSPAEHRLITQQELLYIETSLQSTGKVALLTASECLDSELTTYYLLRYSFSGK